MFSRPISDFSGKLGVSFGQCPWEIRALIVCPWALVRTTQSTDRRGSLDVDSTVKCQKFDPILKIVNENFDVIH
jgi:hypothetical protein